LTSGEEHDTQQALALINGFTPEAIIADKGYDANRFVEIIKEPGAQPVIPSRVNRKRAREIDWHLYRERHG
jgi:transposase